MFSAQSAKPAVGSAERVLSLKLTTPLHTDWSMEGVLVSRASESEFAVAANSSVVSRVSVGMVKSGDGVRASSVVAGGVELKDNEVGDATDAAEYRNGRLENKIELAWRRDSETCWNGANNMIA